MNSDTRALSEYPHPPPSLTVFLEDGEGLPLKSAHERGTPGLAHEGVVQGPPQIIAKLAQGELPSSSGAPVSSPGSGISPTLSQ
jgi:hypothetical protein